MTFTDLNIGKPLNNALTDLGFDTPTPIQEMAYNTILSGRDVVGIAQTGTGKTFAYALPLLRHLKYSEQKHPRILVLVPTRELVVQVVGEFEKLTTYMSVRIKGVYGGTNINTQKQNVYDGSDILVATPGRLLDLALSGVLRLKNIQKLVIDEVDEMLNLGFRVQLTNLLDILPEKRQNLLFSATMTADVNELIDAFFNQPERFTVVPEGTPLDNIHQTVFKVPNFFTKVNLLEHLLKTGESFEKVLVFAESKRLVDRLEEQLTEQFEGEIGVIHSNKSQNYRLRSIERFQDGRLRILIATDIIARGIDFEGISHVINFDTPDYPENYLHRIGRTGRAEAKGNAITFVNEAETCYLEEIESLMNFKIDVMSIPNDVEISDIFTPEEQPNLADKNYLPEPSRKGVKQVKTEKKLKNQKVNKGGSYREKIKAKYKKPKTRGQKPRGKKKR
ncbi:DEAD/DEAH box helicase [Crocinitomix algicola]|uniref:DEAD/DEAH box helicase n=1 Tax=Crocinitomix algicola TaxID=1740263 RepID=UPI00082CC6E9|nr:DEAD/DEAH box helicase [Crocinitomix algicola]